jgi:hypothetical protein
MMVILEQSVECELEGKTEIIRENLIQCHCPTQNPHDLTRAQTRAAAVGSQRLTA